MVTNDTTRQQWPMTHCLPAASQATAHGEDRGWNGDNDTERDLREDGDGSQHPPPTAASTRSQGGPGANSHAPLPLHVNDEWYSTPMLRLLRVPPGGTCFSFVVIFISR
jgi:hypothetical protein